MRLTAPMTGSIVEVRCTVGEAVEQGQVLIKTYEETIPVTVTAMGRFTAVAQTVVSSWELIAGIAGVLGGVWVFLGNIGKALRGRDETIAA